MSPEQEEREQQSAQELHDKLMQITRPHGTSLAATTAIALVRQSIHMAVRNADGSINEDNARKILDEARNALGGVSQRRRRS